MLGGVPGRVGLGVCMRGGVVMGGGPVRVGACVLCTLIL